MTIVLVMIGSLVVGALLGWLVGMRSGYEAGRDANSGIRPGEKRF